jgi:hypothetical protein
VCTTRLATVVVDVHDPGLRSDRLGDLVGVVRRGNAGADVEELAYSGLAGQEATARPRNSRLARISLMIVGRTAMTCSATILSASKWSLPPSQ